MVERIYLGLGSNLGNREENLYQAFLACRGLFAGIEMADVFESLPMYKTDQSPFLNTVLRGYTDLAPTRLLAGLNRIEGKLGRERGKTPPNGPRTIDLDILLYGDRRINTDNLHIPHPLMREREFVLKPLLQLAPDLRDPLSGRLFSDFYVELEDQGVYFHSAWEYIAGSRQQREGGE